MVVCDVLDLGVLLNYVEALPMSCVRYLGFNFFASMQHDEESRQKRV